MKNIAARLAFCLLCISNLQSAVASSSASNAEAVSSAGGLLGASEEVQGADDSDDGEEQEMDSTSLMQTATRVRVESRRHSSILVAAVQILMALVLLLPALVAYGGVSQQSFLGVVGNLWSSSPSRQQGPGLRAGRKLAATATETAGAEKKQEHPAPAVPDFVVDEIMKDSDLDIAAATFRLQTQAELLSAAKKTSGNVPDSVVEAIVTDDSNLDAATFRLQTQAKVLPSKKNQNEPSGISDAMLESFLDDAASEAGDVGVFRLQTGAKVVR